MKIAALYVGVNGKKGRAVFAGAPFAKDECVVADPVVLVSPGDVREGSSLSDHLIRWDDTLEAMSCGPTALLNHADVANCRLESDLEAREIRLVAQRDIAEHEELTIRYRCPLWFVPEP